MDTVVFINFFFFTFRLNQRGGDRLVFFSVYIKSCSACFIIHEGQLVHFWPHTDTFSLNIQGCVAFIDFNAL